MLDVQVSHNSVGTLAHHTSEQGSYTFAYHKAIDIGQEVSLTMPWSLASYHYRKGLHPIFQMNLPEGRLRYTLERAFRKQAQGFDDLMLLDIIGHSQIGRLHCTSNPQLPKSVPLQSINELLAYNGTEDLLRDLLERFSATSGISGIQPKVLICDPNQAALGAKFPTHHSPQLTNAQARITVKGATHIVKGWDENEYPHLALNEWFCMKAAKQAGLEVPRIFLSENYQLLILERFDLLEDGTYLGFEDFCALHGLSTFEKYDGSYERVAKRITQFVSQEHRQKAFEEYFKIVALSCAVRNGDGHLKNFGVLYSNTTSDVWLSPAYDIVSTTPYIPRDSLALMLDGSKRFPSRKKLLNFARQHCNLQHEQATEMMEKIGDAVNETMAEIKVQIKEYSPFASIGNRMLSTWNEGIIDLNGKSTISFST
uniref:Phosphatidylinositol kinase n=1 Tax=Chlorobium chlorochromatii (strain CaD3) TaxID=340177 RepID=Q3AR39_CHLCH